ncbi:uncharacterized protein ATNIH1004_011644 [Aspergillus tanneri]|uniref:Uncharacterized protein n=1 Tax=Aspergillus tanneri TaxID=1220188 RepID=A0A5M9M430_9EURO|nr:uncharacterized protein ATNIH1004_011644 [Aspergillus tanneri]KAA8641508.1 hypothetical protein ATNIH1004_011644 [Aspergillus tanneri]
MVIKEGQSREDHFRWNALEDVLAYAPILGGGELLQKAAEHVLAHVPDLEALGSRSSVLEGVFGRSGLPFFRSALLRVSPAFWELRETGFQREQHDRVRNAPYLSRLKDEMSVVEQLRNHLLHADPALTGPMWIQLLLEFWTFSLIFAVGMSSNEVQLWLAGKSKALPNTRPEVLLDQHFGVGNAGGLHLHELELLLRVMSDLELEIWKLLGTYSLDSAFSGIDDKWVTSILSFGIPTIQDMLTSSNPWNKAPRRHHTIQEPLWPGVLRGPAGIV